MLISVIKDDAFTKGLANKFPDLFSDGLGCYRDYEATFDIYTEEFPKFCKAFTVPYAMKPKLYAALDSLLVDGIISSVNNSKWAAPVVPLLKPDNTIRVCGDYKLTANNVIKLDTYPIPKPEDLFSFLAGEKIFSKLNMSQAYCQLKLAESAEDLTVINNHRGLFRYNRLCFGISSAPGIFQRSMEQLKQGLPGTLCYLDDILVCGSNEFEHNSRLEKFWKNYRMPGLN